MNHQQRIDAAAQQLTRYGDVFDERVLDVLDLLTDINDAGKRWKAKEIIKEDCEKAIELLREISADYEP